jgi:hypothetical protein
MFAKEEPIATAAESDSSSNGRQSVTRSKFFKNPRSGGLVDPAEIEL